MTDPETPNLTATAQGMAAKQRETRARQLTATIARRLHAYIPHENYNDFVADLFELLMEQDTDTHSEGPGR